MVNWRTMTIILIRTIVAVLAAAFMAFLVMSAMSLSIVDAPDGRIIATGIVVFLLSFVGATVHLHNALNPYRRRAKRRSKAQKYVNQKFANIEEQEKFDAEFRRQMRAVLNTNSTPARKYDISL